MNYNGAYYYYLRNGQGDIVGLLDSTGASVVSYTYDAWGKPLTTTGTLATTLGQDNPFRYRGYYYDTETGLYYLKSRYYDPDTCRFLNGDVLMSTGQGVNGHNMYGYCANNPVTAADNDGTMPFLVVTALIGAVVGAIVGGIVAAKNGKDVLTGVVVGTAIGALTGCGLGAAAGYLFAGSVTASVGAVSLGAKLLTTSAGTLGYETFRGFKGEYGSAGLGKAWHHVVNQTANNIIRFGAQVIHNARNIVRIEHGAGTLHSMITSYYNSITSFSQGMRVYEWLQAKSYSFQYNFGLETLVDFAKQIGAKIEFLK